MRSAIILITLLLMALPTSAKLRIDTIYTYQTDKIILIYDVAIDGDNISLRFDRPPRIIPGSDKQSDLSNLCDGNLDLLKVVLFDRVGNFDKTRWKGMTPKAINVPSGFSYDASTEGYHILGQSPIPIVFTRRVADKRRLALSPIYVAVYEKKNTYRIVRVGSFPLDIPIAKSSTTQRRTRRTTTTETELIEIQSQEELEADNDDVTRALSSIRMIQELLDSETEAPFSQILQSEIYGLRAMKERVTNPEVIEKINETLLLCSERERELTEAQKESSLAAQAQQQALADQEKAEEAARQKEAEEKAKIQEEKQQKRTAWMIAGGVMFAIVGFVGNAVFKHFRDIRNQRSIMEMQASLTRQAEHEATRRTREIIRNKAHQVANKGKSKLRSSVNETRTTTKKNTRIKSI